MIKSLNLKSVCAFLAAALLPAYLLRFRLLGVPTTLYEVVVWLCFLLVLLFNFKGLADGVKRVNGLVLVGVFLVVLGALLGLHVSLDTTKTWGLIKGFVVTPIVGALVALSAGKKAQKSVFSGLFVAALIVALSAIYDQLSGNLIEGARAAGLYRIDRGASPNYLSLFLTPIAAMGLFELGRRIIDRRRVLGAALFSAVLIWAIALSASRMGAFTVAAAALGTAVWALCAKMPLLKKLFLTAGGVIALFMVVGGFYFALPNLRADKNSGRVSSSNNIRYEIWTTTVKDIIPKSPFFGLGMGSYQQVFYETTKNRTNFPEFVSPRALTPHNVFFAAWAELGAVGLLGLILILVGFFKDSSFLSIWSVSILAILLLGLVDTPIFKNDLSGFFYLAISVGSLTKKSKEK